MVEAAPSSPFEMPEPQGRADLSIAKLRTRRPAHICETSRYRAVFERPSYVTRWRRTDWLGRRDSNLCILDCNSPKTPSQGVISPLASGIPCVCCRGRITRFDRRRTAHPHATSAVAAFNWNPARHQLESVAALRWKIEDQIEKDGKEAWCALARKNFPPLTER
jgi:hypothetical protein